ncbi:MAG: PQQ-binding-like beta-propeller repeat protein [Opitutaceae bacterium]|nr:PQQ-binding-like beta-propeller repeat protein [Opitutaceae bacterium]
MKSISLLCVGLILTAAVHATDWPEFRGPTGQGHASATALPTEWSATKNVAWKVAVPGAGWSSPAIAGGRIFLTTGVENGSGGVSLRALAFDVVSGRALWDTEIIPASEASVKPIHTKNSPASPTAIVEDGRVYVHFGHHGTACLDRDGKIIWRQTGLRYDPVHGNGGSPALVGDLLVFSADGAKEPAIVALRKATGEIAWKVAREADVRQKFSFSTPLVIEVGGRPQVITPGSGAVSALDPRDGREIWRARYGGGYSVVPRPVFAHGLLFVGTGYNRADLLAIRADGEGDVTDTHIAWRTTKGAPLTPSVIVVGDELYAVADSGVATCFDAKTGTVHWQERLEGNYSASPIHADGKLYFLSEEGVGTVLRASRTFETIAVNKIEERTLASYAVADGALFLRSAAHLFRIGRP